MNAKSRSMRKAGFVVWQAHQLVRKSVVRRA